MKENLGDQTEIKNEKYITNMTLAIIDQFKTAQMP